VNSFARRFAPRIDILPAGSSCAETLDGPGARPETWLVSWPFLSLTWTLTATATTSGDIDFPSFAADTCRGDSRKGAATSPANFDVRRYRCRLDIRRGRWPMEFAAVMGSLRALETIEDERYANAMEFPARIVPMLRSSVGRSSRWHGRGRKQPTVARH